MNWPKLRTNSSGVEIILTLFLADSDVFYYLCMEKE